MRRYTPILKRFSSSNSGPGTNKSGHRSSLLIPTLLIASVAVLGPGYNYLVKPVVKRNSKDSQSANLMGGPTFVPSGPIDRIPGVPFVQYILVGGGTASIAAMEVLF